MSFPPSLMRFFPFLRWFPYQSASLRADFLAGLTVALVLVPQSMAYAQLAGMPAYYGLYAAFLPVAVAALWGSSNQLGTGPVAVASLLTASALTPLAAPGLRTVTVVSFTGGAGLARSSFTRPVAGSISPPRELGARTGFCDSPLHS